MLAGCDLALEERVARERAEEKDGPRRWRARGAHAHRELEQFIVCVHGSCRVIVDDGTHRDELRLTSPERGIHVPPMLWTTVVPDSRDTTVLVLASAEFDPDDYIRDYDEFLALTRLGGRP